jgi:hypothetical protein
MNDFKKYTIPCGKSDPKPKPLPAFHTIVISINPLLPT